MIAPISPFRRRAVLLALAAALSFPAYGAAGAWPAKPVRIVVAYPPGGVSDNIARALAEKLSEQMGASFVVENRAGAGGSIGMDVVAKAAPDGYTLGFSSTSPLTLNPHLSRLPYDARKDIAPVMSVMYSPVVLLGTKAFSGTSFDDMLRQARATPGAVRWATSGLGTVGHVALEQIKLKSKVDITLVPYKGAGQQLNDALGGQFEVFSTNASPTLTQHIVSGKLRPLAVGAPKRLDAMPNVPTFAELGQPKANLMSVFGVYAPAGTPAPVLQRLNAELNKALQQPDVQERLRKADNVPTGGSAADFGRFIRQEYDSNARAVKAAGIRAD